MVLSNIGMLIVKILPKLTTAYYTPCYVSFLSRWLTVNCCVHGAIFDVSVDYFDFGCPSHMSSYVSSQVFSTDPLEIKTEFKLERGWMQQPGPSVLLFSPCLFNFD